MSTWLLKKKIGLRQNTTIWTQLMRTHKHKTQKTMHDRSNREYHLLVNCARQESLVHLQGFILFCLKLIFFNDQCLHLLNSPIWIHFPLQAGGAQQVLSGVPVQIQGSGGQSILKAAAPNVQQIQVPGSKFPYVRLVTVTTSTTTTTQGKELHG